MPAEGKKGSICSKSWNRKTLLRKDNIQIKIPFYLFKCFQSDFETIKRRPWYFLPEL